MEKELLVLGKINFMMCMFLLISLFSCGQSEEYSLKDLKLLEPTHSIIDDNFNNILNELLNRKAELYNRTDDAIILYIDKEKKTYKISATITEFSMLKKNLPNKLNKLKGYLFYKEIPVLLFGIISDKHFDFINKPLNNIMKTKSRPKNSPPPVYEPTYLNFTINKGELKLVGRSW